MTTKRLLLATAEASTQIKRSIVGSINQFLCRAKMEEGGDG